MTLPKFSWRVGLVVGLCITPIAFVLALNSAGAGHGDYVVMRLLYPIPVLATLLTNNIIGILAIGLAAVQFPAYGVFLARAGAGGLLALGVLHVAAVMAAFSGILPNL